MEASVISDVVTVQGLHSTVKLLLVHVKSVTVDGQVITVRSLMYQPSVHQQNTPQQQEAQVTFQYYQRLDKWQIIANILKYCDISLLTFFVFHFQNS